LSFGSCFPRRSGNPFSYSRTRVFPPPIGGFWTPEGLPAG